VITAPGENVYQMPYMNYHISAGKHFSYILFFEELKRRNHLNKELQDNLKKFKRASISNLNLPSKIS